MNWRGLKFSAWLAALIASVSATSVRAEALHNNEPRYSRGVSVSKSGPQVIAVDLELLAGAQESLADVRLFDETAHEVPYLVVPPRTREPTWHNAVTVHPIVANRGESGFEADLGRAELINRIRIVGLSTPVMKRLRIESSTDRHRYSTLVRDATLFDLPEEGLTQLELPLEAGEYRTLRVIWDDRASSPVGLPKMVQARLFEVQSDAEPLRSTVPFDKQAIRNSSSQWRVHLPAASLPVTALIIGTKQEQLLRTVRVSEVRLEGGKLESHALGAATLRRSTHAGLVAANLRIPIQRPEGSELLITIDNGNNPPLTLDDIEVELTPQPTLYFEAMKAGTFSMRYGSKTVAAPSYDLEAERSTLSTKVVSLAKWAGPSVPLVANAVPPTPPTPNRAWAHGSRVTPEQFAFRRPIVAATSGMLSVRLDPLVLAHSHSLQDLRILDPESRQVPYIIEHESEPLSVELVAKPVGAQERPKEVSARFSLYRVTLPLPNLPAGTLVLTTEQHVFRRQVAVLAILPESSKSPVQINEIAQAKWLHDNPNQDVPRLELPIPAGIDPELVISVDDGDNDKLPLQSVRLDLPANSLKFFRSANEVLQLCYGAPNLTAPDYDLALLADELKTLTPGEARLAPELAQPKPPVQANPMLKWFWGVLVFTVLALVALIGRLIRKTEPTRTSQP